mmetsp:Transcript_56136/g.159780  ORF Transcript_56136/g.159780 Transcript_56136/m.159780 type:complete len:218 (+) Transcript_56136:153-806(+)
MAEPREGGSGPPRALARPAAPAQGTQSRDGALLRGVGEPLFEPAHRHQGAVYGVERPEDAGVAHLQIVDVVLPLFLVRLRLVVLDRLQAGRHQSPRGAGVEREQVGAVRRPGAGALSRRRAGALDDEGGVGDVVGREAEPVAHCGRVRARPRPEHLHGVAELVIREVSGHGALLSVRPLLQARVAAVTLLVRPELLGAAAAGQVGALVLQGEGNGPP